MRAKTGSNLTNNSVDSSETPYGSGRSQSNLLSEEKADINRSNGNANKLASVDASSHDWYRFVLSFPPHLVRDYLSKFHANEHSLVLDPFCGTGTTLVECKKLGIPSIGVEAHPMAFFAASVKTNWSINADNLLEHAERVAKRALRAYHDCGVDDSPGKSSKRIKDLLSLPPDSQKLLIRNSISSLPLHKTLTLLKYIQGREVNEFIPFEKLALAKVLVSSVSNLNFGPEVGVGKIKSDAAVISPWLDQIRTIAADIKALRGRASVLSKPILGDSRGYEFPFEKSSIDAVFTSPPYPNEKDYTRTTRLESVTLGFINNKEELRAFKKMLVRSNTRGIYKDDSDDEYVKEIPEIARLADRIEARRKRMGKTSGFEKMYHRVTRQYFGGMAVHLAHLRPYLKPGAMLGYVVGDQASYLQVLIQTGQLLGRIADSLGYELVDIELFRTRLATATKKQLREEVVVLRWPGE